jgi:hypothetical protein
LNIWLSLEEVGEVVLAELLATEVVVVLAVF